MSYTNRQHTPVCDCEDCPACVLGACATCGVGNTTTCYGQLLSTEESNKILNYELDYRFGEWVNLPCCAVFNDKVSEYLQGEQEYLLKLIRNKSLINFEAVMITQKRIQWYEYFLNEL